MRKARNELFRLGLLGLILFYMPHAGMCYGDSPRVGTLRIEGAGIERLVLQDSAGQRQVCYYREPNLILPAGSYCLDEVILQGDYSSPGLQIPAAMREVKLEPGGLRTVKLGAPLRQTIRVERWGGSLVLNYRLVGQGGESYTVTRRQTPKPPAFVIYHGATRIASGTFEPG